MKYTVVVPSFHSSRLLMEVVKGIKKSVSNARKYHGCLALVILDYGSDEEILNSIGKERFCRIEIIRLRNDKGLPGMRNLGYLISKSLGAEAIVYVDNDVIPSKETFKMLLDALETKASFGLIGACLRDLKGGVRYGALLDISMFSLTLSKKPLRIFDKNLSFTSYVSGALFAVKIEALNKIGGFSPDFPFWFDDVDFSLRVLKSGYLIANLCKACALHMHGLSRREMHAVLRAKKEIRNSVRDRIKALIRFYPYADMVEGMYLLIIDMLRLFFASVLRRRDPIERLKILMGLLGFVDGLLIGRKSQRHTLQNSNSLERLMLRISKQAVKVRILKNFRFAEV